MIQILGSYVGHKERDRETETERERETASLIKDIYFLSTGASAFHQSFQSEYSGLIFRDWFADLLCSLTLVIIKIWFENKNNWLSWFRGRHNKFGVLSHLVNVAGVHLKGQNPSSSYAFSLEMKKKAIIPFLYLVVMESFPDGICTLICFQQLKRQQ